MLWTAVKPAAEYYHCFILPPYNLINIHNTGKGDMEEGIIITNAIKHATDWVKNRDTGRQDLAAIAGIRSSI